MTVSHWVSFFMAGSPAGWCNTHTFRCGGCGCTLWLLHRICDSAWLAWERWSKLSPYNWMVWWWKKMKKGFKLWGQRAFLKLLKHTHIAWQLVLYSHLQSISITESRYIEQATVLFYQGKHDRAKQALKLRPNETNSLCMLVLMCHAPWVVHKTEQDDDYQLVISTCFSPFLIAIPNKLLMMINLRSLLLVINVGHWSLPNFLSPNFLLWAQETHHKVGWFESRTWQVTIGMVAHGGTLIFII